MPEAPRRPGRLQGLRLRLQTVGELLDHLARGGRWWLVPLVLALLLAGLALGGMQAAQAFAPFLYAVL